ncbi:ABC transporter permease [Microbacterium sp. 1P10UB]|uniref:ABC transporter permease n=1 Tax=unclassified Microbacterium TaxID=2609290 RepID=UPI0039A1C084
MSNPLSTTALRALRRAGALWAIAVVVVAVAAITLPAFRSTVSINSLLASLAPIVLISIGQAVVIMIGGIDLSVGAVAGLATVVLSLHGMLPGGAPTALVLALLAGLAVGLVNGLGMTAGINPLLMTFAMAGAIQGLALLLQDSPDAAAPYDLIGALAQSFGPVPLLALAALVALVIVWLWMSQSRMGRIIQATGYDPRSAGRLGFPVHAATLVAFAVAGLLAALGGVAIVARTFTADALVGSSSVIDSIATVLVAGILITGGVGSVLNVLPAAVIIAVVGQVITLTGTDSYYQMIFKGVLLLAAMGVYQLVGSGVRVPWRLKGALLRREGARA